MLQLKYNNNFLSEKANRYSTEIGGAVFVMQAKEKGRVILHTKVLSSYF